jgi:hypothetical protein
MRDKAVALLRELAKPAPENPCGHGEGSAGMMGALSLQLPDGSAQDLGEKQLGIENLDDYAVGRVGLAMEPAKPAPLHRRHRLTPSQLQNADIFTASGNSTIVSVNRT